MKRRVVVTGMGIISPLGHDLKTYFDNLKNGVCSIDTITKIDTTDIDTKIASEIKEFDPALYMDKKAAKRMDLFCQYGVAAARLAFADSGIEYEKIDPNMFGVVVGSGNGGISTFESEIIKIEEKGPQRISPFFIPMMIVNMASGQVSIELGAKGPNYTVVTACASSTNAVGDAFRIVRDGEADIMIAGGTEAPITKASVAGFSKMKAMSTRNDEPKKASRPFDNDRDGFIMGEGAGMLVLEDYNHAIKRGARIYAEIVGYGRSSDAYHMTTPAPEGEGAARCMKAAIKDAGISADNIDYVNAHGTSTYYNDLNETLAIKSVFGDHAYHLSVNSTKSMLGHLLGAAGAVEAIATCMQLNEGFIHPTINYETPAEGLDLDYTPNVGRERAINYGLSNSLGFGGHNASIIFKKY